MAKACLVCNMINMEMISIFRHTKKLDKILKLLLDLQATQDDHLCRNCCEEVIKVFDTKQQQSQCNVLPSGESDLNVKIELESEDELKEYFEVLNADDKADGCFQHVSDGNIKNNHNDNRDSFEFKMSNKLEQYAEYFGINSDREEPFQLDKGENVENTSEIHNCVQISSTSESNKQQLTIHVESKKQTCFNATELTKSTSLFENLYICVLCSKTYKSKNSLNRHARRSHKEGNTHKCSQCPKVYKNKCDLKKHLKQKHNLALTLGAGAPLGGL